jgi:hypothetical protein
MAGIRGLTEKAHDTAVRAPFADKQLAHDEISVREAAQLATAGQRWDARQFTTPSPTGSTNCR